MAIRRISELDYLSVSKYLDPNGHLKDSSSLSSLVFETSEFNREEPEVNSYYLSKQLNGADLTAILLAGVLQRIENIENQINNLSGNLCAWAVIQDWTENGMPGTTEYYPKYISCDGLSVNQDIHGCALSAKWN